MDNLLNLGIAIVLWLQSLGLWLAGPMKFFTSLGYEQFYILVAPILIWCIDPALGLRVGLAVMLSSGINGFLKLAFHAPRPYWYDERILPLGSETNFGAPSSHAQNSVVFWGLIAHGLKRGWFWLVAVIMILMISLSRIYLGVHFPSDVVIGWLVGILVVWLSVALEKPILSLLRRRSLVVQILAVLIVSLLIILAVSLVRLALDGWVIPQSWRNLAGRAGPIDPLVISGTVTAAASFFGLAAGALLLYRRGWLDTHGKFWQHVLRYLLGLLGVIVIWYGLDMLFPPGESSIPYIFRFMRYALVGFWVTFLAPLIFIRLKLAQPAHTAGVG